MLTVLVMLAGVFVGSVIGSVIGLLIAAHRVAAKYGDRVTADPEPELCPCCGRPLEDPPC